MKRLQRIIKAEDSFITDVESPTNNPVSVPPYGIIFRGAEEKVENKNDVTKNTFGPSISREFTFEKDIDNPEWALKK